MVSKAIFLQGSDDTEHMMKQHNYLSRSQKTKATFHLPQQPMIKVLSSKSKGGKARLGNETRDKALLHFLLKCKYVIKDD